MLQPPKGLPVRPTTDRAKEALFNILENRMNFEGAVVLDLFSGTGNIAIECCSRGAQRVVAVDQHPKCTSFIQTMKSRHQLTELEVIKSDVFKLLKSAQPERFDLIFADAPYALPNMADIPRMVLLHRLLKEHGILVVEHESHLDLSHESGFFECRKYGQSTFSFFKQSPPSNE